MVDKPHEKPEQKPVLTTPKTVVVPPKTPEPAKDAPQRAALETKPKAMVPPEPLPEAKYGTHPDPLPKVGPSEAVQPLAVDPLHEEQPMAPPPENPNTPFMTPADLKKLEYFTRLIVGPLPNPKQDEFDRLFKAVAAGKPWPPNPV